MCLVAQVVRAPVQCSEGCEQHNLAVCLPAYSSVHLPMTRCISSLLFLLVLKASFARLSRSSGGKSA